MRLLFDLWNGKLLRLPHHDVVVGVELKRGDGLLMEIEFQRAGVEVVWTEVPDEFVFAAKVSAGDAEVLLLADSWAWHAASRAWRSPLLMNGVALAAMVPTDGYVDLVGELTFTGEAGGPETSQTIGVRVHDDVWKGTEGTPLILPTPDAWLDDRAVRYDVEQGLSPEAQAQARENLGVTDAAASAFEDLTDAETADLPAINTPLSEALAGKADAGHNHDGDYAPATGIDPTAITGTAVVDNDARLHDEATVSGDGISIDGQEISLDIGTAAGTIAAGDHDHVSADITDATSYRTPNTIVLRGDGGEAEFGKPTDFSGVGIQGETGGGVGVIGGANETGGVGVWAYSVSGTALYAQSESGTYHAEFGNDAVILRSEGLFGWIRSNLIQPIGAASELADDRAITLPDRDGTVVVSDPDTVAGESAVTNIVSLSEDDYTALVGKDESTLYVITPNPEP
jgi:hypothetical protein